VPTSGAPILRSYGGATDTASLASVHALAAGENSFNLTFSLDRPGTLNFLVLYSAMLARYGDAFVAFDNLPSDPASLLASDLAEFSGGVIARGSCAVASAGSVTSCRIGPEAGGNEAPSAYACSPTTSCQVQNTCFGSLCDYGRYGIVANTTYKVGLAHVYPARCSINQGALYVCTASSGCWKLLPVGWCRN
jgi:hypothetical protein